MHRTIRQGHIVVGSLAAAALLGAASFASAHEGHDHAATVATTTDMTCMAEAVETREDALIAAWDSFNTATKAALETRKDALEDAWNQDTSKSQKKASIAAWKAWKKASKEAHAEFKTDRKAAWDTFKTTAKSTCKVTTPKEEALEKDAAGTISI